MSNVVIGDILPYTQATAILNQTVFGTNWTANYPNDVVVYRTPSGNTPNDVTQILAYPADYSVSFIGSLQQAQVTLVTGAAAGDIITITRQTPADRLNLYFNTNFTPSMLNNDFGILTLVDQQAQLVDQKIAPRYNYSAHILNVVDTILPILAANQVWAKDNNNDAIIGVDIPASGIAPAGASYVLLNSDPAELPNSLGLSDLASGIMINDVLHSTILARLILGTTNQINVTNGNGLAGNIGLAISNNPLIPGTAGMGIPQGSSAQRITPVSGIGLRFNTDLNAIEYYAAGNWIQLNTTNLLPLLASHAPGQGASLIGLESSGTVQDLADHVVNITNVQFFVAQLDASVPNAIQFDPAIINDYLPLAGGTMTGDLFLNADPTDPLQAATKQYVDNISGFVTPDDLQKQTYVSAQDTGTADNYVFALTPSITGSYITFQRFNGRISNSCTGGACTIDFGLGPVSLVTNDGSNPPVDSLVGLGFYDFEYDGTIPACKVLNPSVSGSVTPQDVQNQTFVAVADTGTTDNLVVTCNPPITSLEDGLTLQVYVLNTSTINNPTITVDSNAPVSIFPNVPPISAALSLPIGYLKAQTLFSMTYKTDFGGFVATDICLQTIQNNALNTGVDVGSINAPETVLYPTINPFALTDGLPITITNIVATNTAAANLVITGVLNKPIVLQDNSPLIGGEMLLGGSYDFILNLNYNAFILKNPSGYNVTQLGIQGQSYNSSVDSGTTDAFVGVYSPAIIAVTGGMELTLTNTLTASTGAGSTFDAGPGPIAIVNKDGSPIRKNQILVTAPYTFNLSDEYGAWVLMDPSDISMPTAYTPILSLVGGVGNTVPTFTTNNGSFVTVGNLCFYEVALENTSGGSGGAGTGELNVSLPIPAGLNQTGAGATIGVILNGTFSYYINNRAVAAGDTTVRLAFQQLLGTVTPILGSTISDANSRELTFKMTYQID